MKLQDLPVAAKDDGLTLLCMNLLGEGISRLVYSCTLDPRRWVVKVEKGPDGRFQNVSEHQVWRAVEDKPINRWFAPVLNISDHGRWLVQARTAPIGIDELRRNVRKIPAFFTDTKVGNWGRIGNRIVCHDYGLSFITENGLVSSLRKADWWE